MFRSHMFRIRKNRLSMTIFILLLLLPSLEIIQYYIEQYQIIKVGGSFRFPIPVYAIFQSLELTRGLLHSVFFWFLPIFLLLILADDSLTDLQTGYYNILLLKVGRKKYCLEKIMTSFVVSFFMVMCALFINFVLVHIIFHGGTSSHILDMASDMVYDMNPMLYWTIRHPYITDFLFIFLAGVISGIAGAMGAAFALFFKDRKTTYIATFAFWEILGIQNLSIFLIFQPYSEYLLQEYIQIFVCYVILFVGSIGLIIWNETRKKEYIK